MPEETAMSVERDYVLGTHDAEVERLGLQHTVWRPRVLAAWRRAGFTRAQRILDVGCGPGYASFDLAEIVGPEGEVVGIDRSERFLKFGREQARRRDLGWIDFQVQDLDEGLGSRQGMDGAWCRWIFAFVTRPHDLLARIGAALKPGARLVVHEYLHYATWRLSPRSEAFERFVAGVMKNWRAAGGEPDIALPLLTRMADAGFEVERTRTLIDVVPPTDLVWQWPAAFARGTMARLVEDGVLTAEDAEQAREALRRQEVDHAAVMVTPAVLEIVAVRAH